MRPRSLSQPGLRDLLRPIRNANSRLRFSCAGSCALWESLYRVDSGSRFETSLSVKRIVHLDRFLLLSFFKARRFKKSKRIYPSTLHPFKSSKEPPSSFCLSTSAHVTLVLQGRACHRKRVWRMVFDFVHSDISGTQALHLLVLVEFGVCPYQMPGQKNYTTWSNWSNKI